MLLACLHLLPWFTFYFRKCQSVSDVSSLLNQHDVVALDMLANMPMQYITTIQPTVL